jgi:hypothetical protein
LIVARNVFFSFDFDDIMAVNVVRNSNVVRAVNAQLPFKDKSIYDAAKNTPGAVMRAIDDALTGSSVTVVLNGAVTAYSSWVRYEIARSFEKGNGFIVIDINGVGAAPSSVAGPNPLLKIGGTCASDSNTINVHEFNGSNWIPFAMLKQFSNTTAKYPRTIIEGNYNLQQRFTRHMHWKNAQMYFSSVIEAAAKEAGWQPLTVWL